MLMGLVEEGLEIVRVCRDRYDGRVRNPFNEYECGHWYARAMSSYALLQGLSGARYDAVEKVLYLEPTHQRRLPLLPLHRHRLRHGRRAQGQSLPRGGLGQNRHQGNPPHPGRQREALNRRISCSPAAACPHVGPAGRLRRLGRCV